MNQSIGLPSGPEKAYGEALVKDRPQPRLENKDATEVFSEGSDKGGSQQRRTYSQKPSSPWSSLWYGLGVLAPFVLIPIIPGVTSQGLVMGFVVTLVSIYSILCIWGMVRCLRRL